MGWRHRLGIVLQVVLLVAVVSLFVGSYFGQPVLLSYVETGSMEPEIDTGDGFIAIPSALTDTPEPGDVVVFEAQEIQGGGLTTHQIIEETDRGYVTRGVNNPFTDQDTGEPYVKPAQIKAEALQIGGTVVTIPHLGSAVMWAQSQVTNLQRWLAITFGSRSFLGAQGLATVLGAAAIVLYILDTIRLRMAPEGKDRARERDRETGIQYRWILVACAGVLVLTATMAMVVPGGSQEIGIVSAEFTSENPTTIQQGTTGEIPQYTANGGLVPAVSYFGTSSSAMTVDQQRVELGPRSQAELTVTVQAPDATGYYRYYLYEHRYLAILPLPVIDWLHSLHPWAPIVVIDGLLGSGIYLLGRILLPSGRGRLRRRSTQRPTER